MGFSIINHPVWGTPVGLGNLHGFPAERPFSQAFSGSGIEDLSHGGSRNGIGGHGMVMGSQWQWDPSPRDPQAYPAGPSDRKLIG